jgi:hypothetical protein
VFLIIRDDPKLPDGAERYPNLKDEGGGSIPGYEISSLLDGQLVRWSIASCALVLAYRPSVSKKKERIGAPKYVDG